MKIEKQHKFSEFFTKYEDFQLQKSSTIASDPSVIESEAKQSITKRKIDFLVLHHIQANSAQHAISQLKEHQVSSHFLIDENGEIYELVDENDIAYHAGKSYWRGVDGLNSTSIGIEFINSQPFSQKFKKAQMLAGVELCRYLIEKYKIEPQNVVGHSDIAYFADENGLLDRKQDPSHLFDWKFLAKNNIGIFPVSAKLAFFDRILFKIGDKSEEIAKIKQKLADFGYKVQNFDENFDEEMQALVRVFNRRFNKKDSGVWLKSSEEILCGLVY